MFGEACNAAFLDPYDPEKLRFVTYILHKLDISPGYPGFYYLRDAILYADFLQRPVPTASTQIYQEMARRYDTDPRKVERAIHTVLTQMEKQRSRQEALRIITGVQVDCPNRAFRNMEFISFVTETLRLHSL